MRGITSASIGEMPIVRMASISSFTFIVPICAAKADPERPATMIAVINTPSSRKVIRPTRLIVSDSAPNCSSCTAPCWAITIPIRKLIKPMIGKAETPTSSICRTSALPRNRPGCAIKLPQAISTWPMKPITLTMPRHALNTRSPICAGNHSHSGRWGGRISASLRAVWAAETRRCARSLAPLISASCWPESWQTTHAPTVSISVMASRSISAISRSIASKS